jgi:FixJ family two-component response regulator
VCFVDDDQVIRMSYTRLARSAQLRAQSFASVAEFIEADGKDQCEFACVVCDIWMPDVSGFELPGYLARRGRSLPIIFVTGDTKPATEALARKLGAFDYFRKPVEAQVLLDAIAAAIQHQEQSGS